MSKRFTNKLKDNTNELRIGYEDDREYYIMKANDDYYIGGEAIDKLAHYEDMEEQGRLIELPCKVGDTVYFIKFAFSVAKSPITAEILSIKIIDGEMIYTAITQENSIVRKFKSDAIGKTVFFTKSEAEAKLKEMSSSENPNK